MAKFTNQLGDVAAPFFIEIVQRGVIDPTVAAPRPCVNVWNFRRLTNSLIFDPTDIAASFRTALNAVLLGKVCPQYSVEQYECRGMDDPTAATAIDPGPFVGTRAEDMYAGDDAVYMQLKTGFRGRNYFGSKHFGGFSEEDVTEGYLNTPGKVAWQAVQTLMLNWTTAGLIDTATNSWKLCVISRMLSNLESSPAVFSGADVSSILLNARVGTMGRRRGERAAV